MTPIKPTVGRVIYVRSPGLNMGTGPDSQPFAALIAYVFSDTLINVGGIDNNGVPFNLTSVQLIPSTDDHPALPCEFPFAYWMPYQIGAAADKAIVTISLEPPVPTVITPATETGSGTNERKL